MHAYHVHSNVIGYLYCVHQFVSIRVYYCFGNVNMLKSIKLKRL